MRNLLPAALLGLTLASGAARAQPPAFPAGATPPPAPAAAALQIKAVKPNVFMVVGAGGNSTVVVGKTGVVLVDTKNPGQAIYQALVDGIKSITPLPVAEVLITHHHADHSGNAVLFLDHGVTVIGHRGVMQALQTYAVNATPRPTAPGVIYADALTTRAGGVTVEAHHWSAGHTQGDTVVYFPAQKVVASGDEVVETTPNVDYPFGGSIAGWLRSLDAIALLDFDVLIPGHGSEPMSKAEFLAYRQKWATFVERGRAMVRAGTPKDRLLAAIRTDDLGWTITTPQWSAAARLDPFYAELSR